MSFFPSTELHARDEQLKNVKYDKYQKIASEASINKAVEGLKANSHSAEVVSGRAAALEAIKKAIPSGAAVHNPGSTTLNEIGYTDYLKNQTDWRNLHGEILAESDQGKQAELRRKLGGVADYFVSSVNAITEKGEFALADWSGTRVGPFANAGKVIVVVGANKIVPTYKDAKRRIKKYSLPLESARVRIAYAAYGIKNSQINNYLAIRGNNPFAANRIHFIIVKDEVLGF